MEGSILPPRTSFHARPPIGADTARLIWRKNGEPDFLARQHFERLDVHGRFRQPHSLRLAPKSVLEIRMPQSTCVRLSREFASGMIMWL